MAVLTDRPPDLMPTDGPPDTFGSAPDAGPPDRIAPLTYTQDHGTMSFDPGAPSGQFQTSDLGRYQNRTPENPTAPVWSKPLELSDVQPPRTPVKPPETWWENQKQDLLNFAETFPNISGLPNAQAAAKQKIDQDMEALGILSKYREMGITVDHADVVKNLEKYTGQGVIRPGVRGQGSRILPSYDEAVEMGMGALVAVGLAAAPVTTAIGVAGFEAIGYFKGNLLEQTRKTYLTMKDIGAGEGEDLLANRRTHVAGTYRSARDYLPETASTPLKAIFDAAEFAAMGKTLHSAYGPGKFLAEKAFEVATHDVIRDVRGPERVFISPEKIRDIFQTGEKIGPEEAELVGALGLNAEQYRNAFDYGLNIDIPTAKVTRLVEKPWWGKVRELFKIDPYEAYQAQTDVVGKVTGSSPIAALPEGKGLPPESVAKVPESGVGVVSENRRPISKIEGEEPGVLSRWVDTRLLDDGEKKTFYTLNGKAASQKLLGDMETSELESLYQKARVEPFTYGGYDGSPEIKPEFNKLIDTGWMKHDATPAEVAATPLYPVAEVQADVIAPERPSSAMVEGGAVTSTAPVTPDMAYLSMQNEAQARALESVMQKRSAQTKKAEADARQTFKEAEALNPIAAVSKIQINYDSALSFFGKQGIEGIPVGRLSKSGGSQVDIVAQEHGLSTDEVLDALKYSSKGALEKHMASHRAQAALPKESDLPFADAETTALENFQAGVLSVGGLDKTYVEANYPPEVVAVLSAGNMLKVGGAHPDNLAQQLGYADETAMLGAVSDAFGKKLTAEQAIRTQLEASGEMARYALDSEEYATYLAEQAKILEKLLTGPRTRKAPKVLDPGNPTFAELQVDESAALEAALKRAERASRDAFRAGDVEGALAAKEHQKAIVERARARRDMRKEIAGIKKELEKASKNTKIPLEYQDRVAGLLDSIDVRRGSKTQQRLDSLSDFLARQEALGEDTSYIPVELIDRLQRTPLTEYTIEDLRDLRDSVAMVVHLGETKGKLLLRNAKRELAEVAGELSSSIFAKAGKALEAQKEDAPLLGVSPPGMFARLSRSVDVVLARTIGPEFSARALDGYTHEGPAQEFLWSPMKAANDAKMLRMEKHTAAMDQILAPVIEEGSKFFSKKYSVPGVRGLLTMNQAVSIVLNSQRPINVDHMVRGNKIKPAEIKAVSEFIPNQYRKMVGEIWDYNESLFPEINAVNVTMTGQRLKKTAGRYYPAALDRALTDQGNRQLAALAAGETAQAFPSMRPGKRASFREKALGGNQPLELDLAVWVRHLEAEALDTSVTIPAQNVAKVLYDPSVKQAIVETRGEDEYNALVSWLKNQRSIERAPQNEFNRMLVTVRNNMVVAQIALNWGNLAQQVLSVLNVGGDPRISSGKMVSGVTRFMANGPEMFRFASENSVEFRNRVSLAEMQSDRDLASIARAAHGLHRSQIASFKAWLSAPTNLMDRAPTTIAWTVAYEVEMVESGNHAKAVAFADSVMARTQSSGNILHRPQIMNEKGATQLWTMFMTWQMAYMNQFRENVARAWQQPTAESFAQFGKFVFWGVVAQQVLNAPLKYGRLPDKKELAADIITAPAAGIPILRNFINPLARIAVGQMAMPFTASPLERLPQTALDLAQDIKSDSPGHNMRAWLHAADLGLGYGLGLPVSVVTKPIRATQEKKRTGKGNPLNMLIPRQKELKK